LYATEVIEKITFGLICLNLSMTDYNKIKKYLNVRIILKEANFFKFLTFGPKSGETQLQTAPKLKTANLASRVSIMLGK